MLFILGMFFLALPFAEALGVTPGIHRITFVPLEQYAHSFTLTNSAATPLTLSLLTEGGLAPYLTLPSTLTIQPHSSTHVPYTLNLPASLAPGFHDTSILITEQQPASDGQTSVDVALGVFTTIRVFVPYPEAYPVADVTFQEDVSQLKIHVENLGTQDIKDAYATVNIGSETLVTSTTDIPGTERRDLLVTLAPEHTGTYRAYITLHYDGKELSFERSITTSALQQDLLPDASPQGSSLAQPIGTSLLEPLDQKTPWLSLWIVGGTVLIILLLLLIYAVKKRLKKRML